MIARPWNPNALHAQDLTLWIVKTAQLLMADKPFKVLQLNTQKKQETMHSLMNDGEFETFGALLISEPKAWRNQDGVVISSPMAHRNWTKITTSQMNNKGWAFRSMMWLRSDLESEQVPNRVLRPYRSVYLASKSSSAHLFDLYSMRRSGSLAISYTANLRGSRTCESQIPTTIFRAK